jgi:hypothetical protein
LIFFSLTAKDLSDVEDFPVEDFPRFSQDFAQNFQDSRPF